MRLLFARSLIYSFGRRIFSNCNFVAQGGDWGASITQLMALQAPTQVLGIHSNMPGMRIITHPRSDVTAA
jgi:hypothetical protein